MTVKARDDCGLDKSGISTSNRKRLSHVSKSQSIVRW